MTELTLIPGEIKYFDIASHGDTSAKFGANFMMLSADVPHFDILLENEFIMWETASDEDYWSFEHLLEE